MTGERKLLADFPGMSVGVWCLVFGVCVCVYDETEFNFFYSDFSCERRCNINIK